MAAIYSTREWREARAAALERDGHQCTVELPADTGEIWRCPDVHDLVVHHIDPVEAGGHPFDLANLLTICRSHHTMLHWMMNANDLALAG